MTSIYAMIHKSGVGLIRKVKDWEMSDNGNLTDFINTVIWIVPDDSVGQHGR